MEELTRKAEEMQSALDQIRATYENLRKYCTGKCRECPLGKECLGDGMLDPDFYYSIEMLADYINYHDKVEAERAEEIAEAEADAREQSELISAWEDANRWAGIDPTWMNIRR